MALDKELSILRDEIIVCGRFPKHDDGSVNLSKVDRLLRHLEDPNQRIAVLRKLLEREVVKQIEEISAISENLGTIEIKGSLNGLSWGRAS